MEYEKQEFLTSCDGESFAITEFLSKRFSIQIWDNEKLIFKDINFRLRDITMADVVSFFTLSEIFEFNDLLRFVFAYLRNNNVNDIKIEL
jgi:hypothetical protein